jgi:alkylglycerol monooxygenase
VAAKYPVYKIEDVYHFDKYDTQTSAALNVWSWIQLLMILFFVSYMFGNIALINGLDKNYIFWYGGFVFLSVYALTDLMDRNASAIVWECIRSSVGLSFIFVQDDWFGAGTYLSTAKFILGAYFIISIFVTGWFVMKHRREDAKIMAAA